jgi:hypothetical protein
MKPFALLVLLLLSACAPSAQAAQTAAAQTQAARPTPTYTSRPSETPKPSDTPNPTATSGPTVTQTPQPGLDELRQQLLGAVPDTLSNVVDVDRVTLARFRDGALEIELKTKWAGRIRQAAISYTASRALAGVFAKLDRDRLEAAAGGPFAISLATYSAGGDYRYRSVSDWDTIQKLASKSIGYEEWVVLANGGFR